MEDSVAEPTLVEITVKPEPMDFEEPENSGNSEDKQPTGVKEEEIWIKSEPIEVESQNSVEREEQETQSENESSSSEEDDGKNETKDLKSKSPKKSSKKKLDEEVKLENEIKEEDGKSSENQETKDEKNATETSNEQPAENTQPKMETHLMYSYEVTKNIEIVTINEEERQKEYEETLKTRQHMRHVCEHCAVGFVLKHAYDVHMKVHSPESGDYECLICHSRLKTADMLYRHRLRHYRRYRCLLCWMRFKDKDTAACHVMNDHTGESFECDHCGRGFKRPQYLKRHVEQYHTKPHRLVCGVCFRVFHERGWYRSHIRTHNEEVRAKTVRLPATCEICSRDYKNKASLKRHLLTHDEDVNCDICYEKCKNRITLGQHYLKVHNEKYVGAHEETCPQCERVCATRAMLKRHVQRMHSDRTKKYQCDYCQRLYLTKGENKQVLNRHKKSHSNEMYPCNECGLLFKTQPYVKVHYQLKHLNMTRAEINAQRKANRNKPNMHKTTNWEPPISNKKKSTTAAKNAEDPLLVQESEIQVKIEREEDLQVPTFQTFADISRE
uniref:C2H2-type domain-containing protein n=1 Tax=Heliothis virescens TaxID=7102 RepID=A0A2A4J9B9_HELVI